MRRLLAIVLAAGPLVAGAQVTPPTGTIYFGGSSTAPTMNLAQCNGDQSGDTYGLTWTVSILSGSTFPLGGGGAYRVFASSNDPGTASPYCYTPGTSSATVAQVTTDPAAPGTTSVTSTATVTTSALRTAAGYDCSANKVIYVCVAWYANDTDVDAAFKGYAKGQVTLSVAAPAAPTIDLVWPGDKALVVDLADNGGSATATTWRAKAVNEGDANDVHYSSWGSIKTGIRIDGLQNGIGYTVTAFARSDALNESPESSPYGVAVKPQPVLDAWGGYKAAGGRDAGGCDSGPAGLLAFLGAASLLGIRRRS